MITSSVSEESLARDIHTRTDSGSSTLNFSKSQKQKVRVGNIRVRDGLRNEDHLTEKQYKLHEHPAPFSPPSLCKPVPRYAPRTKSYDRYISSRRWSYHLLCPPPTDLSPSAGVEIHYSVKQQICRRTRNTLRHMFSLGSNAFSPMISLTLQFRANFTRFSSLPRRVVYTYRAPR